MKARLESGKIVKYSQIPNTIVSGGKTYVNAKRLSNDELEELGFFDVIVPDYDPENGTDSPSDIVTERDGIRTSVTTKESEINALTTKASILKYDINF